MRTVGAKSNTALGFLTIIEHAEQGLFGGYLILNHAGRPLEFHCTAPVKPNRAQQILYGPTLEPYLFGEQIGQTLLGKAKNEPQVVCTDREPALAVREFIKTPVVLVLPPDEDAVGQVPTDQTSGSVRGTNGKSYRLDAGHPRGPCGPAFQLGRNRLAVSSLAVDDQGVVSERLSGIADTFDLREPFERIREAIEEARRGGQ